MDRPLWRPTQPGRHAQVDRGDPLRRNPRLCAAGDRKQRRLRFDARGPAAAIGDACLALSGEERPRLIRIAMADVPQRYITSEGLARIRAEYDELFGVERPKIVETVSWAASLGDRSENADYIYGKRRLREIDRRLAHLARIMKAAKVVDPAAQTARDQIRFGATVEIADSDDKRRVITIVGDDEANAGAGKIGWNAPLARAL